MCDLKVSPSFRLSLQFAIDKVDFVVGWEPRHQLLVIRLASKQVVQVTLVDSTIGLSVAAQFGSRVTCSCHITITLEYLLAKLRCWPSLMNLRI